MKPPTLVPAESIRQLLLIGADTARAALVAHLSRVYIEAAERLRADVELELHARSGRTLFLRRAGELTHAIDQALLSELALSLEQFSALDDSTAPSNHAESAVRGLDAFEQQLAYDRATYRHSDPGEANFQELGWRLARARGLYRLPPRANPLRAAVFFRAIVRAFVELDVYRPAVLPLLKALDSPLAAPLRDVYRQANLALGRAGAAAPQAQIAPPTTAVSPLVAFSDRYADQRAANAVSDEVTRIEAQIVAADSAPTGEASSAWGDTQEAAALARSLAARMGYELIRLDAGYPPSISDIRKVAPNAGTGKFVRLAIEFMHTLFQSVVDDGTVPEEFLNLILHLQIPMLRMTLAHPDYVAGQNAPGQPLVRRLCATAAGWTPAGAFNQRLLQAARDAVRSVIAEADAGPQQLHDSLLQFVAFLSEEAMAPDSPVERIRKARVAADERKAAEVRMTIEVGRKLAHQALPLYLRDFLLSTWVTVLHMARDRAAEEPGFAEPFERLVDEITWSVQNKASAEDRARLTSAIPRLLATIYRGLALIGKEQSDFKELVMNLMTSHAAAAATPESLSDDVGPT